MTTWVVSPRRKVVIFSALILVVLMLNLPLLAAGPAPAQNGTSGPRIWLQENQPLPVIHRDASGQSPASLQGAQPVSMASGDIDADGFDDLLVGYSAANGGVIAVHRGNIDAFAPQSDASFQAIGRGEFPSPFHLEANTFSVPVSPDFIALGNFTGSGNGDLAVAARGGNAVYIFPGDGKGSFGAPETVGLSGGVTALVSGNFGGAHQPTLVVGLNQGRNSTLLVLAGSQQGVVALGSYAVKGPISNILFDDFGDAGPDIAFLAGGQIQILRSSNLQLAPVPLPVTARAFALGSFIWDRNRGSQIALVAPDGTIQIVARSEFDPRVYTVEEFQAIRQANRNHQPAPAFAPPVSFPASGWKIVESFSGAAALGANQTPLIFRTRISINGADDVMVLNAFSGQLTLVSHADGQPGAPTFQSGQVSLRPYNGTPIAALPMRINVDGRLGVVALHNGEIAPSLMEPIPDPNFWVNRTDDPVPTSPIANACVCAANNSTCFTTLTPSCSLREAILKASGDTIMLQAGQTYQLTRGRVTASPDYTGDHGALYVNNTATIMGGNQSTTIIKWGTLTSGNTVDMVMAVNEDISPITNATGSLSNLTIQGGINHGTHSNDGDGGCMEFDTGSSGTANLTLTNVTLQNCSTLAGNGGGIAIFNITNPGTGSATITGGLIQNNTVTETAGAAGGGGILIAGQASMVMSSSQVKTNHADQINGTGIDGTGGGIFLDNSSTTSHLTQIHSSTISGNTTAGFGGGISADSSITVDQGTVISGNTAGGDTGAATAGEGGGIYVNIAAPPSTETATLTKVAITGNSARGNGGGVSTGASGAFPADGALTMSFSRLAGNTTSGSGSNLNNHGTTVTAKNNWWGTNDPASTINTITTGATTTFDPFIVLTHTSAGNPIKINTSTGLTADMSKDNHGNAVGLSNLTEIIGLPITFDTATLGSISGAGTVLDANAQATATFNAGGTASSFGGTLFGGANANVDQEARPTDSFFITSATESGSTATITTAGAHGFSTGQKIQISGVGVSGYNTPANQLSAVASTPTANTFTYNPGTSGLAASSGGNARAGIILLEPPTISKGFSPKTIQSTNFNSAAFSTLTFTITNPNVVAIDASFTDNLPVVGGNKLVVASSPGVTNTCTGSTFSPSAGDSTLSFSTPSLAPGTCTVTVKVSAAVDDTYSNTVSIDSTAAGNNSTSSTDTLTVINPPHISKSFGASTIPLNGTTLLTISVANSNNVNQTLSAITFTDTLPNTTGTLVVATPNNLTDNCSGGATANPGSGSVSLASSSLAPGASCTVSANVQGTAAGVANNSVTANDTTAGSGAAGTKSITVVAPPMIGKAFSPSTSIPLNGITTITFTINNPNTTAAGDLTGVAFSDTLPSATGTLVVAPTPNVSTTCGGGTGIVTATAGSGVITVSGGSLAHNSSCTISVDVKGTVAGNADNTTGAITSTEGGTGTTSNTAPMTVVAPPSIAKAFNPNSIPLNGTSTLTFTITNPAANTVAESGVAFSDTLPTGLVVATPNGLTNSCNGTPSATAGGTSISLTGGSIPVNSSCTVVVNVTGTAAGSFSNTSGAVSSTNGGTGNTANDTLTVVAPPSIGKAFNPNSIPVNGTSTLTFTITNPAANTVAQSGVAFSDTLPAGLVVATPNGLTNSCNGTPSATAGGTSISLTGGSIPVNSSCTVVVNVTGTAAGSFSNTSGAVSSTNGGTGNTANDTLTVVGPPSIAKAFNPNSIPRNGTSTLTFTITNPAANTVAATGVAFSDTLPTGLVVATPNGLTNSCGGTPSATAGGTSISLTGGSIPVNSSCTVVVNVTGGTAGSFSNTSGAVSSTNGGTGNTANDTLTVVAPPSIGKAFNPTSIPLNGTSTLTFTITNPVANTVAENGVAFSDILPTGLVVSTPNGLTNSCGGTPSATSGGTSISLTGGSIAVNSSCTVVVNVTGTASGQYTNTSGAVSSTNGGTGNTATANLTVASPPSITKSFSPTSIVLNGVSTLSFTITNPNTGVALSGVAFTDSLPSGVQVAAAPNVTGSCGSGTITATAGSGSISLSGGTLTASPTAGSSCTFSADVTGTTAGGKSNNVQVTSTEGGTGNTSNATLTVTAASTSTGVTSSSNPSVFGQSVTFTATVTNTSAGSTGAPTGSVQFVVDNVNFGSPVALTGASATSSTATSAAIATLSVAGSPHTVSANYVNADGNFTNSSGSLAGGQTVTQATTNTAVVSSSNPSVFGQSVTFTATVVDISAGSTAQPTGSVQFVVDNVNFGSPVTLTGASSNSSTATSQATATLSIAGSPHSVSANYVNADGNFSNSTGSLAGGQVVNQANTTTTVTSSQGTITLGDTVTFTATVTANPPGSGTPTGLVTFFEGATPIGTGTLNGSAQATFSTALLAVGSDSITAIYRGDADFNASPLSSPTTETVNLRGSTTSVALNPASVGAGQASTITATVTDAGASTPPGTPDVFSTTGAPATARTGFTSTLFADGLVLVAGGTGADGTTILKSAEIYSVTGAAFTATGNLNTARTGAVAVLLPNGKVLVAGGSSNGSSNGALNSAELFDPIAGTFAPSSHNMTAARFGTTATVLNTGKVLLAGGSNSGGVLNSAELYDPASDTFTATGNMNSTRTGASATLLGTGKVLVAGGSSNGTATGARNSAELFDPAGNAGAGSFTAVAGANPTLATGRWQPEAAPLLSGKVLVAGGQDSGGVLTTADLYDPAADSFTASAHQMNEARANGFAVNLPNGMVLLPGGTTSKNVDLYDADNDKFNLTGSLLHFDNGLVSTLLNNGRVLVVGINTDNDQTLVSDAELYSPSFNPLGTVGLTSPDATDVFGPACVLTPSSSTASTCTSTVTPTHVGSSPRNITGTYPADAVHSGSSNSASLTVTPTAPPTIAKAFSQDKVAQNSKVNVSFTIINPNPAATLTGISFTDTLQSGLVVATPNNLSSNCGGTVTAVPGSSSITLTGGTLAPPGPPPQISRGKATRRLIAGPNTAASGQCVITVDLLATGTGVIPNVTGPISSNEGGTGNPSNTANVQVVLPPTVNKNFGAASIPVNGTTSLTFNIANPNPTSVPPPGTITPLNGITLNDTLPSGLVVATPNGLTGSCTTVSPAPVISATQGGNSINLSALNLPPAGSCSFSVNVTGTSGGTKNNTTAPITGTFDDGSGTFRVATGATASASIIVVAPPVISKTFVPSVIAPSTNSTLSFTITNPAANTVAENGVAFTDTLPANVVIATPNGLSGSCGGTVTATAGTSTISLTGGSIAAASSCVFSVNVTSSVVGSYTNTTGAVSSTNGGTGNTASATLTVAHANLSITKTHSGNFSRGQTGATYTITVSNAANAGPTIGTVTVTDTLPNVPNTLVPTGLSGTGWTCNLGTLTCTRSDVLAPGGSYPAITLTVNVPINIQANVTNSATVSGGGDPNSHTANDLTHIGPPIVVTPNGANSLQVNPGGTTSMTFTVDSTNGEGTVNMSCSGLPPGVTCSFNPPSTGQLTTTVTLTITAAGNSSLLPVDNRRMPMYAAIFPLLGLAGLALSRNKRKAVRLRLALVFAGIMMLLALAGCGGRTGQPALTGSFPLTVTATSPTTGDSGSTTITLNVL